MISILPESNYAAVMTETVEPYLDSRRQEMAVSYTHLTLPTTPYV